AHTVEPSQLVRRERCPHLASHRARDFALKDQHVGERALPLSAPEITVVRPMDELYGNPHAIAGAQHGSLDEGIDSQLAGDPRYRCAAAFVPDRRLARYDA